jgi:hypothetical protein
MKNILLAFFVIFALAYSSYSALDTRLVFVSNYSTPTEPDKAILTFDVELQGDGSKHLIKTYQNAISLSHNLNVQVDTLYFTNHIFPNTETSEEGYQFAETYQDWLDPSQTWIQLAYIHRSGAMIALPESEEWIRAFTIQVIYKTTNETATVDWFPDPWPPLWVIRDNDNERIDGEELPTPEELQDFTLSPQVVPVELALFEAKSKDAQVELNWETATETNNMGFKILRSNDEKEGYLEITNDIIKGKGNSESAHSYSYQDKDVEVGKTYYYKLMDIDYSGRQTYHGPVSIAVAAPEKFELLQNFPNPFNPETTIKYNIKDAGYVTLSIFNTKGQLVRKLIAQDMQPGAYDVVWDGRNELGNQVTSGVYFFRIDTKGFTEIKKMQLLR